MSKTADPENEFHFVSILGWDIILFALISIQPQHSLHPVASQQPVSEPKQIADMEMEMAIK